ncbi:MAG TPA: GGDEF domain-containing protein [Pilimelia sp.]|nr:GGDEF domain-containing protein [Pilimelia sp.]
MLGDALKYTTSMDAARERYRQAEALAARGGEVDLQLMALNNLAYGEYRFGRPERSWAEIERLLEVAAAHGQQLKPSYLDTIARTQIALGRHAEAEQTIRASLAQFDGQGFEYTRGYAEQLLTLAMAQRCLGATGRAQESLDRCRCVCDEHGHAAVAVRVQEEQAELYAAVGSFRAAFEAHKAFHAAAEQLRSQQREAQARTRQVIFETAEAREDAERFREQARRDPLTGLHNRRYVDEYLPALITEAARTGAPLTVAMVDLDHFKRINDTLSHHVGDGVLMTIAALLRTGLGAAAETGLIARIGGEEFLVVLPGAPLADATHHLERLRTTVRSHDWRALTGELLVTVSIGAASTEDAPEPGQSALLAAADRHLYSAKRGGRDRVVTGSPTADHAAAAGSASAPAQLVLRR